MLLAAGVTEFLKDVGHRITALRRNSPDLEIRDLDLLAQLTLPSRNDSRSVAIFTLDVRGKCCFGYAAFQIAPDKRNSLQRSVFCLTSDLQPYLYAAMCDYSNRLLFQCGPGDDQGGAQGGTQGGGNQGGGNQGGGNQGGGDQGGGNREGYRVVDQGRADGANTDALSLHPSSGHGANTSAVLDNLMTLLQQVTPMATPHYYFAYCGTRLMEVVPANPPYAGLLQDRAQLSDVALEAGGAARESSTQIGSNSGDTTIRIIRPTPTTPGIGTGDQGATMVNNHTSGPLPDSEGAQDSQQNSPLRPHSSPSNECIRKNSDVDHANANTDATFEGADDLCRSSEVKALPPNTPDTELKIPSLTEKEQAAEKEPVTMKDPHCRSGGIEDHITAAVPGNPADDFFSAEESDSMLSEDALSTGENAVSNIPDCARTTTPPPTMPKNIEPPARQDTVQLTAIAGESPSAQKPPRGTDTTFCDEGPNALPKLRFVNDGVDNEMLLQTMGLVTEGRFHNSLCALQICEVLGPDLTSLVCVLWEQIVRGKRICVVGRESFRVSVVVLALVALTSPLAWPVTANSFMPMVDAPFVIQHLKRLRSFLLGTTNAAILANIENHVDCVVMLDWRWDRVGLPLTIFNAGNIRLLAESPVSLVSKPLALARAMGQRAGFHNDTFLYATHMPDANTPVSAVWTKQSSAFSLQQLRHFQHQLESRYISSLRPERHPKSPLPEWLQNLIAEEQPKTPGTQVPTWRRVHDRRSVVERDTELRHFLFELSENLLSIFNQFVQLPAAALHVDPFSPLEKPPPLNKHLFLKALVAGSQPYPQAYHLSKRVRLSALYHDLLASDAFDHWFMRVRARNHRLLEARQEALIFSLTANDLHRMPALELQKGVDYLKKKYPQLTSTLDLIDKELHRRGRTKPIVA